MIKTKNFQQLMGGLNIAILPQIESDVIHCSTLGGVLRDTIRHEAKAHSAAFDPVGFRQVMRAMSGGDVEVLFFAAAWDVCDPKIVGAAINFRSLFLQRNGRDIDVHHGIYSEDVCLLFPKMREIILERPRTKDLPEKGLGMPFIQASIDYYSRHGFKDGTIPIGQAFEFAPSNSKIIAIKEKLGATLGHGEESALLRIAGDRFPDSIFKLPVEVRFVPLANGTIDPNNFVVSWESADSRQKIMASFTKGISTFKGTPVTQCQFISNGKIPNTGILQCAVASILQAAEHEIGERCWGSLAKPWHEVSPNVPLGGSAQDVFAALFKAQNVALLSPKRSVPLLGVIPPPLHIHALQEPEIVSALKSLGAKQRMLGNNPMQTATLDLRKAAERHNAPNRPLALIEPDAASHNPIFSLAV
ncbi:MAG: hypothetical protein FWF24_01575 [Alphaproteobacteria bacterium]|nr:hypothetical protein [Alphaproteobacteria bacterium]